MVDAAPEVTTDGETAETPFVVLIAALPSGESNQSNQLYNDI
jgi:hypothetical protein